jgi:gamma-D-glutamyl-L-lysine dipeptidyl-peptidase
VINTFPVLNVYKKNSIKSEVSTQLLYGDSFKKIKQTKSWIKIKNISDNYKGFIVKKKFLVDYKNTHKVNVLYSFLYSKPNNKSKISKKLSFGSRIKILEKNNNFYRFNNHWIKKKNLQKINYINNDIFYNIKKFINVKYKWGGKNYKGVDCSGLVQLFVNYNNKFCPRDTKDQIKYFKKKVIIKNIKKNDLIFWKGHVAIAISKSKVIHAYGPFKKVVIMSLKETISRIDKTANLKVIGLRRIV